MIWRKMFFLMLLLLVGTSSIAGAEVLCKDPSESLLARVACRGNETQLNPMTLGLAVPSQITGLQTQLNALQTQINTITLSLPVTCATIKAANPFAADGVYTVNGCTEVISSTPIAT